MSRFLLLDVGAGTLDILFYDDASDQHYKAVVKSPVRTLAETAARSSGNLLISGCEMGGGPITAVLRQRTETDRVVMTASAAYTLNHDPEKVRSWGIQIIDESDLEFYDRNPRFSQIRLADIDAERIKRIVEGFGVSFSFDIVGICAQDHGMPPAGASHLDYRHSLFKENLDLNPLPHTLLYSKEAVPATFNRLCSIARSAETLPTDEIYVMDSGMAAIIGASMDRCARAKERLLVLDIATSHTVGAAMMGPEIAGFFEYHTHDITLDRIEYLLQALADGTLDHRKILEQGGHGAYIRKSIGFQAVERIVATGPKRRLVLNAKLPIVYGAPWGDNMMTGTVGLLEAIRWHKSFEPIPYV